MEVLLEKTIEIAKTAGRMMLSASGFSIDTKGTKENYVTTTDLEIQKYLRKALTEALPGSKFMGEEDDLPGNVPESYSEQDLIWIVDPIDGTSNYAHGIPNSVTAIGLVRAGEPIMGVVYHPYLDEVFFAEKGKGAFRNGQQIHVSNRPVGKGLFCTAWSCYNKARAALCFDVSQRMYSICDDIRRTGTAAYELCLLAKGAADLYFEVNLAPWDYTASMCILSEAGGVACSQYGKIRTDRPCLVIAANTAENLEIIKNIVTEEAAKHPEAGITF